MAKLEGVKVMDMVNGEVTRVEYGGEVYEKVDGPAQKGDLMRPNGKHVESHIKHYAFYYVIDTDGYSADVIDDAGKRNGLSHKMYDAFRKISVQPSLADRVTAVEAKLNVLSSRVDKLEGKTDEAISTSLNKKERPTVGDFVKVIQNGIDLAKIGDYAKIVENDKSDIPFKCEDLNGSYAGWFREDEVEKVTDENELKFLRIGRKPGEFKVGDIVRTISYDGGHPKGTIGEISELRGDSKYVKAIYKSNGSTDQNASIIDYAHKDVELIAPVEARVDRQ